jgi:thiol-disulfide isomerase/thioredoxin
MKTGITLILIAVLILGIGGFIFYINTSGTVNGIVVGDTAIDIKFTTLNGTIFNLSDHRGKIVVIDFVTTSCSICVEEFKVLKQIASEGRITLVSINLDGTTTSDLQKFGNYYELTWIIGNSQKAGIDYQVSGVPTMLVIDKEGVIRYRGYYTSLEQLDRVISQFM